MLFGRRDRAAIWFAIRSTAVINVTATNCSDLVYLDPVIDPLDRFFRYLNVFCSKLLT